MASLPRPSRPSLNPPTGPLPSLPVLKTRDLSSNGNNINSSSPSSSSAPSSALQPPLSPSSRSSTSSIRPPTSIRAVSSSLPSRTLQKNHSTTSVPSVPTVSTSSESAAGSLPPGKTLRKTVSIGAFPQPPKGVSRANLPPSPLSATTPAPTMDTKLLSATSRSIPQRRSSIQPRTPKGARRVSSVKSPLTPPNAQGASNDAKPTSNNGFLSLPSPPQSRNSSAQGSYATSATTFEDLDDDLRGREHMARNTRRTASEGPPQKDSSKGNVVVSVRVRPDVGGADHSKTELEWMVDGRRSLISFRGKEGGDHYYDNVFTQHDQNAKVYDAAAKRLVRRVMEGYHGTVFAYGMTGTGKTFSMQGTATSPGVIPLAITDIFSYIRETPHREFLLRVSYLEIYNERIHDLLSTPTVGANGQPAPQEEIKLREDPKRGVYAMPLKEEIVQSPTQLLRVIARGDNARRVAGTQFNARSSRSHAVVQIVVESRERTPGSSSLADTKRAAMLPGGVRVSTLSLIDLAGSEKAAESKERRTEGAHINKSLLTLGTVIANLSGDKDKAGESKDKAKHLPYRDSKLTRLLQPALSGNSLVSILCTIQIGSSGSSAAANSHTGETLNTLKFASRAKNNIVSHAKKAEEAYANGVDAGSIALLDRYRKEIVDLRKQLEDQNVAKTKAQDEEEEKAREREAEQRHEEQILEMQLARTALKERIEHLNRLIISSKSLGVNNARSFSSLSHRFPRTSVLSNAEGRPASARSSQSHAALEVPSPIDRSASLGSVALFGTPGSNPVMGETASEEDSVGENGDGIASQGAQINALQADLADKNRYISTLEKRLLQARRSSQSRVSLSLRPGAGLGDVDEILREKDAEIAELRAVIDDKDRMISALRSAARARDVADLKLDTASLSQNSSPEGGRRSVSSAAGLGISSGIAALGGHKRSVNGSNASIRSARTPQALSPVLPAGGLGNLHSPKKRNATSPNPSSSVNSGANGVEGLTKILDEMISERVAADQSGVFASSRQSTSSGRIGGRRVSLQVVDEAR